MPRRRSPTGAATGARVVAPVGLWFRFGHWYLVAWDLERDAVRTFRVDRIDGDVTRGEPGSGTVPDGVIDVEAALPDEPWEAEGDDRSTCASGSTPSRPAGSPTRSGRTRWWPAHDDGSVDLVLGVSSFASIRSWVLGLLDHATILEPPAFRDELVAGSTPLRHERRHSFRRIAVVPAAPMRAAPARRPGPCRPGSRDEPAAASPPRRDRVAGAGG